MLALFYLAKKIAVLFCGAEKSHEESDMSTLQAPRIYAVIVGLLMAVVIGVATPYNEMMVRGSRLGLSSLTPAAFFLFFVWWGQMTF